MKKLYIVVIIVLLSACDDDGNSNLHYGLIGKWKWTRTCISGVIGVDCGYANQNTAKSLEITYANMTGAVNHNLFAKESYSVTGKRNVEDYIEYQIRFNNETTCVARLKNNTLEITQGGVWSVYER